MKINLAFNNLLLETSTACRSRGISLIMVILVITLNAAYAQLERHPHPRVPTPELKRPTDKSVARTKETSPLSLPFWDDFSRPYRGIYPDTTLWKKSFTIWINDGMAINPPSINVATFDGLDSAGSAYNANEILLKGFTDSLVSNVINLSETGAKPVLSSERNSVYLSFAYQWQGNGEAPDIEEDYIVVEFKNINKKWEEVLLIRPEETFRNDLFYDAIVQVNGEQFFHETFQFRIRAFGRQSGPYDTWNVDYVYLNKGRTETDLFFPDRAIVSPLTLALDRYNAVPYRHFLLNTQFSTPTFAVSNLQNGGVSINYNISSEVVHYHGDVPSVQNEFQNAVPIEGPSGFLNPKERKTATTFKMPDAALLQSTADSVSINIEVLLNSGDNNSDSGDYDLVKYHPIEFTTNDTLTKSYTLASYYAYDDGTAEYTVELFTTGNLIAYQFELREGVEQDTLIAFDIYLPSYGITSNQIVDFYIYPDADGLPDSENAFRIPSRPVRRKGINEFQRIRFLPAQLITQRKFYIGWKQPISGRMLAGLDMSNDTGDRMFVNTNGTWEMNNRITGSLMLRPVFGKGEVDTQVGIEDEKQSPFSIYPNPSRGSFYINGKTDRIEIYSITGKQVSFESEQLTEDSMLVHIKHPAGLYLVRCTSENKTTTRKIVITE